MLVQKLHGGRAMTATSANGLSYMWEMIYIASSMRLPIVMSLVNRAVSRSFKYS